MNKNIIIVGKWNLYILTEEWVRENLITEAEFKIEYPILPNLSLKISTDSIAFFIENNRFHFEILKEEDSVSKEIVELARKTLQYLCHTPVSDIGINLEQTIQKDKNLKGYSNLKNIFAEDLTYKSQDIKILWKLEKSQNECINITLSNSILNFNFNYKVKSTKEALSVLSDDAIIIEKVREAKEITEKIGAYGE